MKQWQSDDEVKAILERLVMWYTFDEIATLLGRTKLAIARRAARVGVCCIWRGNGARYWTRSERNALYMYAGSKSQRALGERLGRSRHSVGWAARASRIAWNRNRISLSAIARLAGCSVNYVSIKAKRLWPRSKPAHGKGVGSRWNLSVEQARTLMLTIRPGRADRVHELYGEADG